MAHPSYIEIGKRHEQRRIASEKRATALIALASLATLLLLALGVWVAVTLASSYGPAIAAQLGMP